MSNIVLSIEGIEFHADNASDEPRVLDIQIGTRAGLSRPRKIREVIRRNLANGFLNDSDARPVEGRQKLGNIEQDVTSYWLSEVGALKVITKLETPEAHAMVGEIIRVYRLAIRMLATPTAPLSEPSSAGFLATLAACKTVGENPEWKRDLCALIGYAAFRGNCSWAKAHGSLRQYLGVSGYCRIPATLVDETKRYLHKLASTPLMLAPKRVLKLVDPRQTVIPFDRAKK